MNDNLIDERSHGVLSGGVGSTFGDRIELEQRSLVAPPLLAYDDAHLAATLAGPVFDNTVELGEQRVVAAAANVEPWMNPGATLPHQNGAGGYRLAVKGFWSKPLGRGVATVPG
jgi:hypothetical protein